MYQSPRNRILAALLTIPIASSGQVATPSTMGSVEVGIVSANDNAVGGSVTLRQGGTSRDCSLGALGRWSPDGSPPANSCVFGGVSTQSRFTLHYSEYEYSIDDMLTAQSRSGVYLLTVTREESGARLVGKMVLGLLGIIASTVGIAGAIFENRDDTPTSDAAIASYITIGAGASLILSAFLVDVRGVSGITWDRQDVSSRERR